MTSLREAIQILRRNLRPLVGFEAVFKLATTVMVVPLVYGVFNLTLRLTGYSYLTAENVRKFLGHPLFWLCPLILFLIITFYSLIDISAVVIIMDCSYHDIRTDALHIWKYSLRNVRSTLRGGRRLIAPILGLLSILFSVSFIPSVLNRLTLPDYLLKIIFRRWYIVAAGVAVLVLLLIVFLRYLYAFHYMTLEDSGFRTAMKQSARLSKGKGWKDLLAFIGIEALFYILYIGFLALELLIAAVLSRLFSGGTVFGSLSHSAALIILMITLLFFTLLGSPVCYSLICLLFYRRKRMRGEKIISVPLENYRKERAEINRRYPKHERKKLWERSRKRIRNVEVIMVLCALILGVIYIYGANRNWFNPNIEYVRTVEVTAHRGASRYCPENTMAAFEKAVEQEADWIELDVHLSSDGQIFVMHDSNFKRTAGVNAYAWSKTYDEIAKMDAGSWFGREYAGEKIPLLSEAIEMAKERGVRLNIEIKPSPQEEGLEEKLVAMLEEEDFIDRCVVTSQSYSSIEKVKQLNDSITTVYVMGFAYGNIDRLQDADHFSIRASSISSSLVSRVHNAGKLVYAWTVNTSYNIDEMIDRRVDNIITDNVPLAKERIGRASTGDLLNDYLRLLNDMI